MKWFLNVKVWCAVVGVCLMSIIPTKTLAVPRSMGSDDDNGIVRVIRVGYGGDYVQLDSALAAAPAGSIIEILPGLHLGQWIIDRPLTLRGRHGAVLDGGGVGTTITVTAPNVTIQALNVQHTGTSPVDAAILVQARAVTIEGNRFERFMRGIVIGDGVEGSGDAAFTIVRNNTLIGSPEGNLLEQSVGITLLKASTTLVELNTIVAVQTGIAVADSPQSVIRGNAIRFTETAIVSPLPVHPSSIFDVTETVLHPAASNILIEQNTLEHNATAVKLVGGERMTIRSNLLRNQQVQALLIHNSTDLVVTGNRFQQNTRAITIGGHGTVDIQRNRFLNNEVVLNLGAGDCVITMRQNDLLHNRYPLLHESQAPDVVWEGNYWEYHSLHDWWFRQQARWSDRNRDGLAELPYLIGDVVDPSPALEPYLTAGLTVDQSLLSLRNAILIGISLIGLSWLLYCLKRMVFR